MRRRKPSVNVSKRNEPIVEQIQAIKAEHPFWGYRRIWAYLRFVENLPVNKKRILRLMREHDLLVKPNMRITASRMPIKSKPKPTKPNEWWGIDMTKVMVESFGWMYIVIVLDWHTKKIVGCYAGLQCRARHWLAALDVAVIRQFPEGSRNQGVSLMADNGCQPTSETFMKTCHNLGIKQAFTSYNNPKGNADTERMIRTMKEELFWLREWRSPFEVAEALEVWVEQYNKTYLHSALGYKTPERFENECQNSRITQLVGA